MKFYLLSFLVFGALGPFSWAQALDEMRLEAVSGSSVSSSRCTDDSIQQQYLSSEDDDTDGSVYNGSGDLFSAYIPWHSTLPIINLNYETCVNSINSFHYVLTFGFYSLRSPPLFS